LIPKQFRIHIVLIVTALFMIIYPILSERPNTEKAEKATNAAMEFLKLVDSEKYAESWELSADLMKEKVTQQEWVEKLTKARTLSGALIKRSKKNASYSTSAQDSPEGEYIALTFDSKYQRAASVSEHVTVMLEGDRWRVAGYFIQ